MCLYVHVSVCICMYVYEIVRRGFEGQLEQCATPGPAPIPIYQLAWGFMWDLHVQNSVWAQLFAPQMSCNTYWYAHFILTFTISIHPVGQTGGPAGPHNIQSADLTLFYFQNPKFLVSTCSCIPNSHLPQFLEYVSHISIGALYLHSQSYFCFSLSNWIWRSSCDVNLLEDLPIT